MPPPLRKGYLIKEPVHRKAFAITQNARRRWFVLRPDVLEWFADSSKTAGMPKGRMMLEGARLARLGDELILGSGDERLVVRGPNIDDWERTIKQAIGIDSDKAPEPRVSQAMPPRALQVPDDQGAAADALVIKDLDSGAQYPIPVSQEANPLAAVDALFASGSPTPALSSGASTASMAARGAGGPSASPDAAGAAPKGGARFSRAGVIDRLSLKASGAPGANYDDDDDDDDDEEEEADELADAAGARRASVAANAAAAARFAAKMSPGAVSSEGAPASSTAGAPAAAPRESRSTPAEREKALAGAYDRLAPPKTNPRRLSARALATGKDTTYTASKKDDDDDDDEAAASPVAKADTGESYDRLAPPKTNARRLSARALVTGKDTTYTTSKKDDDDDETTTTTTPLGGRRSPQRSLWSPAGRQLLFLRPPSLWSPPRRFRGRSESEKRCGGLLPSRWTHPPHRPSPSCRHPPP